MQLKLTTDYGVRTLLYLAIRQGRLVPSAEIAETMYVSRKYLMKVCSMMRDAGLILSYPGVEGGYCLARPAEEIRLYDVVQAMEHTIKLNRCLEEDGYCNRDATEHCPVHVCYSAMQEKWENFLKGITIGDLRDGLGKDEMEQRIVGEDWTSGKEKSGSHW